MGKLGYHCPTDSKVTREIDLGCRVHGTFLLVAPDVADRVSSSSFFFWSVVRGRHLFISSLAGWTCSPPLYFEFGWLDMLTFVD